MPTILSPTTENLTQAAQILRNGQLLAFPTETVYGLGANALDATAVQKIFELKGRPRGNPLIVHLARLEDAEELVDPSAWSEYSKDLETLSSFIPGPLTIILPKSSRVPEIVTAGKESVALRVPSHPIAQRLLSLAKLPIAAPSANRSTRISPTSAKAVSEEFSDSELPIIDGAESPIGIESTVLSLCETPFRLLRHGSVTQEELTLHFPDLIAPEIVLDASKSAADSPGQSSLHYAPKTPLRLRTGHDFLAEEKRIGYIALSKTSPPLEHPKVVKRVVLSPSGEMTEIARNLYRVLREFDTLLLDCIVIDECERVGLGRAIMDKLARATRNSNE